MPRDFLQTEGINELAADSKPPPMTRTVSRIDKVEVRSLFCGLQVVTQGLSEVGPPVMTHIRRTKARVLQENYYWSVERAKERLWEEAAIDLMLWRGRPIELLNERPILGKHIRLAGGDLEPWIRVGHEYDA